MVMNGICIIFYTDNVTVCYQKFLIVNSEYVKEKSVLSKNSEIAKMHFSK